MGPGGVWRQRAARAIMIAACAFALASWASAFPDVAFHGLGPTRPAAANQPLEPAGVTIVHLRGVDIFIRKESPRSKNASGSRTSGVAAAAAAIVAPAKNGRTDLQSQKPHKVITPTKPQSTPSSKPAKQSPKSTPATATASPAATVPSTVKPADSSAQTPVDTSPIVAIPTSGGHKSAKADHRSRKHNGDHGQRNDPASPSDGNPGRSGGGGRHGDTPSTGPKEQPRPPLHSPNEKPGSGARVEHCRRGPCASPRV